MRPRQSSLGIRYVETETPLLDARFNEAEAIKPRNHDDDLDIQMLRTMLQ